MVYNRIQVAFGALKRITGPTINYQYDVQQILVINGLDLPEYYVVDFCNEGDATVIPMTGTSDGVEIPDSLLQTGKPVKAYIVVSSGQGDVQTRYEVKLPVNVRPTRADIDPTDDQQQQIDALVAALNSGVARAEEAVEHYPKIVEGYWYVWDGDAEEYVPTGIKAEGVDGTDGTSPSVTINDIEGGHRITITDKNHPLGQSFNVLNGTNGTDGDDGYSPAVTITSIEGGHRVTITDKDHPQGQSFNVMDGQGGGGGTSDYTQLTNKPQINGHTLSGDQTAAQLGLGTYTKPSDGIPKTDLESDVQTSLGKADTALQTAPVASVAGKTGAVTLNGGDVAYSDSETYAAGSIGAEVSQQKNAIEAKQDAPSTAGTAGQVLGLDSNLAPAWVDQTGGSGGGGMNIVNLSGTQITQVGADNTFYVCGELTELTFTAPAVGITMIRFTSGTTPTVLTISGVTAWMYDFDPDTDIEASKTYDINVLNGVGCAGWA